MVWYSDPFFAKYNALNATADEINATCDVSARNITVTGNVTLSPSVHGDKNILLNPSGAMTATLAPATGAGTKYNLIVLSNLTNPCTIDAFAAGASFQGRSGSATNTTGQAGAYKAAGANTITFNGGSQGGKAGDRITITDIATNVYAIEISAQLSAAAANPFSTSA